MCGFAGMVGFDGLPADKQAVDRMTAALVHRGPDDGGLYMSGSIGFGFRRLSILDLTPAAHQPMVSEDGQLILVFNGAIYNYVELRRELQSLGHTFRSTGDTEVLLHAYRQWGPDCLQKLNGMWAFLIYDRQRCCVFGSRDRFGVKPLFYYRSNRHVLFASEIKGIRASGLYQGEVNWKIASNFLLQGQLNDGEERFFTGIHQLPPGTAFELDIEGNWKQWRFWSLSTIPSIDCRNPALALGDLFEDSVRLRMRSDQPVGVTLSGGLDSTSIICMLAKLKSESEHERVTALQAFCFMAEEFDESAYISDTLIQTQATLHRLQVGPLELWDKMEKVLWFHDEPVHSLNAFVGFELMMLAAKNGIRVVLCGQGADEVMAGYSSYFPDYWEMLIRQGRIGDAWNEIQLYAARHVGSARNYFLAALGKVGLTTLHHLPAYHSLSVWKNQRKYRHNRWFSEELCRHYENEVPEYLDLSLNNVQMRSVENAPLPLYLRIEDRNSMAHSVETRLPFLDYRLVSLVFNMASEWKLRGPWNKFVLREAMRQRIPESVRTRVDKMGFPVPDQKWFAQDLYGPMQDLLASQAVRERGIYNVRTISDDLQRHRGGHIDVARRLFNVAQFETLTNLIKTDPLQSSPGR
jgi:asparagine synthase (glutamine-hydrolysing)